MKGTPFVDDMGAGDTGQASEDRMRALFQWERALLGATSLPDFLTAAAEPAGAMTAPYTATLLLSDPTHELRHMLLGGGRTAPPPGLLFADSLAAMAPQLALVQEAWLGEYRAADHALLFPGASGLRRVALFPLRSRSATIGSVNLATNDEACSWRDCEPWLLAHVDEVMSAALERQLDAMRLRRGGHTSPLTGWHTRRYMQARLKEAIARCQRHGGDVSCVLIDVDGLKGINDAYGQLAGDQALHEVAGRIEGQLRASDAAAHVDADEFIVLLPDTRVESAIPLAERILDAVRSEPIPAGPGLLIPMSVSIGLASVTAGPDSGQKSTSDHLLAKAESALHLAKTRGGNRYSLSDA
jgi:two-component system, cell cycle response regulator